jgi:hypothetical protein
MTSCVPLPLLRALEGREERVHLVAVDCLDVEAHGFEVLRGVGALRLFRHGVEGDRVRVVDEDEVVELLMTGKLDGFERHALLQAAVSGEADDVVIEDGVLFRVEARLRHLRSDGHADGVSHTLAERTGRRLDPLRRA